MWVVKIGGSLAFSKTLPAWLEVLVRYGGGRVIIVPGGGKFANLVRRAQQYWKFADDTAHGMALSAMDQFGFMMAGIRRELTPVADVYHLRKALGETRVPIWLPSTMAVANNAIAASWEFSSDSLAAVRPTSRRLGRSRNSRRQLAVPESLGKASVARIEFGVGAEDA